MKKITIIITTYNRPEMLDRLVQQIAEDASRNKYKVNVMVFLDGCSYDIDCTKYVNYKNFTFLLLGMDRHGKQKYWSLVNTIFKDFIGGEDYVIMIPDDITLVDGFFDKAVDYWEFLKHRDSKAICLSILTDERTKGPNWTNFKPVPFGLNSPEAGVYEQVFIKTAWNDLCFISGTEFFEALKMPDGNYINEQNPPAHLGSGVGRDISVRLHGEGYGLYHVAETLVTHSDHESVMNKELREKTPLKTK